MTDKKKEKKLRESSITRVQPVLRHLLVDSSFSEERLHKLLKASPRGRHALDPEVLESPGAILDWCRKGCSKPKSAGRPSAFEKTVPPPREFLKWLLENPGELTPPSSIGKGEETLPRRNSLLGRESKYTYADTLALALQFLDEKGPENSGQQWWALEGFTHVDCLIETERLVLFVEGKRTDESKDDTSWFPFRNQIARNLECARAYAKGKSFAVLLAIEEGVNERGHYQSVSSANLLKSWPHLKGNTKLQGELLDGFLGILSWQEILHCWGLNDITLPDTIHDAEPFDTSR